ncbi:MAG: hypothetical protein ABL858_10395 [Candidatus Nitrotoga sp.]
MLQKSLFCFGRHHRQCDARRVLFTPQRERDAVLKLVSQIINATKSSMLKDCYEFT